MCGCVWLTYKEAADTADGGVGQNVHTDSDTQHTPAVLCAVFSTKPGFQHTAQQQQQQHEHTPCGQNIFAMDYEVNSPVVYQF